jgi:1-acyl-sn-glycerol-3-phosphate acyltransferase
LRKSHFTTRTLLDAGNLDPESRRAGNRYLCLVKKVWLAAWVGIATLLVFPPIMLVSPFSRTGNRMFHLARLWAWIVCRASGVKVRVHGLDRIDRRRSYVIIANHQSHFDGPALALGLSGMQFRWIAKQELLGIPVFGHCLKSSRNIFIDRSDRAQAVASIQKGMQQLPDGVSVMCFAEGSRSEDGTLGPFKKGGLAAALQSGRPILPVTINGSRRVLPRGSVVFKSGTIELTIAAPIETRALAPDQLENLMDRTREVIQAHFIPPSI